MRLGKKIFKYILCIKYIFVHIVKCTYLKCIAQLIFDYVYVCLTTTQFQVQNISRNSILSCISSACF